MRLLSDCGAHLELGIAGYQYPGHEPGREPLDPVSWDANWLVVTGSARTADGASWSFSDPALTTWEAAELAAWLGRAGDGAPLDALSFTEPNLSFAVAAHDGPLVRILAVLSHESAEPPRDPHHPSQSRLPLLVDRSRLAAAAAALQRDLAAFPVRR